MLKCSLELSKFDIRYERRKSLTVQVLADFLTKITMSDPQASADNVWTIFVDGASSSSGSIEGIILEKCEGLITKVSLILSFTTSNNQDKYEAFLAGLRLAKDLGAQEVKVYTDSNSSHPKSTTITKRKMTPLPNTWS